MEHKSNAKCSSLFCFLLESTDVSEGAEMVHLVLLLRLCAEAALAAQV